VDVACLPFGSTSDVELDSEYSRIICTGALVGDGGLREKEDDDDDGDEHNDDDGDNRAGG
jgi:hypothetical protein